MGQDGVHDSCDEILRLAPDCDPTTLRFSPAEGYLLSRVDGYTPWRLLREIGGLPPDEVDLCLESWLARGILLAEAAPDRAESRPVSDSGSAVPPTAPAASAPPEIDESLIDPALDLGEEEQQQILEFEAGMGRNFFEVLGVSSEADRSAVKKAYFVRCRQFHPDRYYRREIGPYADRLNRIFKHVVRAYEQLSDDDERARLAEEVGPVAAPAAGPSTDSQAAPGDAGSDDQTDDQTASAAAAEKNAEPRSDPVSEQPDASTTASPPPAPRLSRLDRLKQRMPLRIAPEKINASRHDEGRQKAEEIYKAALVSLRRGKHAEAIANVRLALVFDEENKTYRETLERIQWEAEDSELGAFRDRIASMSRVEKTQALRICEQANLDRPGDPEPHYLAAWISVELGSYERAQAFAERAIELNPDAGKFYAILGRALEGQSDWSGAIAKFEEALRLDPADDDSSRRLAGLRWRIKAVRSA